MNDIYLNRLTTLLKHTRPRLARTHRLAFKNVFGAVGGYVNGRIFISCGTFGIALKLPPEILETLFKDKDVKPLKYFRKGHVKKEYAVLPQRILNNRHLFKKLLDKSMAWHI